MAERVKFQLGGDGLLAVLIVDEGLKRMLNVPVFCHESNQNCQEKVFRTSCYSCGNPVWLDEMDPSVIADLSALDP